MRELKIPFLGLMLAVLFTLGGCASSGGSVGSEGAAGVGGADAQGGVNGQGVNIGGGLSAEELAAQTDLRNTRVIYFDFDSSEIKQEYRQVLEAHAVYLSQHPDTQLTLEGHTDERGTREYNIALGEGRAQAVERLMLLQGVARQQSQVISFGEERPVAMEHDEAAWRLNRRVEILYSE